ncbi:MAG: DUF6326 family protein [Bacteroidales bacterium]|nr:DUF6326 family protein [Bacteroidales bacterium]MCF8338054.1 DUF6326 family protein [Bacteroidales bacterium]
MTSQITDRKAIFSTLWIFATLNYLYCDVVGLMDAGMLKQYLTGTVKGTEMSESFLLWAIVFMQIPMGMVLLSRVLKYKANRLANIISGSIMTLVQLATLFVTLPASYYIFSSVVEISTTLFIVWYAVNWRETE